MTVAVCAACGAFKHGAWTRCVQCQLDPATPEDQARALMLSDRNLSREDLERMSARIKAGEPVTCDPAAVAQLAAGIARAPKPNVIRALMVIVAVLGVLGAVGVFAVACLTHG